MHSQCDKKHSKNLQYLLNEDPKTHQSSIKQIFAELKVTSDPECIASTLESLSSVYFECDVKYPLKKSIYNGFKSLPIASQSSVTETLGRCVRDLILDPLVGVSSGELRNKVNSLASLLDNSIFGMEVIGLACIEVYRFLSRALREFLAMLRDGQSLLDRTQVIHHSHVVVQTMNKLLHKFNDHFVAFVNSSADHGSLVEPSLSQTLHILEDVALPVECRCNAGIHVAELILLCHQQNTVASIISLIFPSYTTPQDTTPQDATPQDTTPQDNMPHQCFTHIPHACHHSHLYLIYGVLSVSNPHMWTQNIGGSTQCLLLDVILPEILASINRSTDTTNRLLSAKCLVLWTYKTSEVAHEGRVSGRLGGKGDICGRLMQVVWSTWDDHMDVMRSYAKTTFENIIQIHLCATQSNAQNDSFIDQVIDSLMSLNWSVKGKYTLLGHLIQLVRVDAVLSRYPLVADSILSAMKEQTLSCYGSELYQRLCEADLSRGREWCERWVNPVLRVICGGDKQHKQHIVEYVVPRLLKVNSSTLDHVISELTSEEILNDQGRDVMYSITWSPDSPYSGHEKVGALVTCVRRARCLGLLKKGSVASGGGNSIGGVVDVGTVEKALTSVDDQVRLEALYLVCENYKSSELVSGEECHLVTYFMRYNMNSQSPSFRQHFTTAIKKFLRRLRESCLPYTRNLTKGGQKQQEAERVIARYQTFLSSLLSQLFCNLYPGASPPRVSTALTIIKTIVTEVLSQSHISGTMSMRDTWSRPNVNKLVECFADSFEDTKRMALDVLRSLPRESLQMKQDEVTALLQRGLRLSESCRPHDCNTGAYLLQFLLLQACAADALKQINAQTMSVTTGNDDAKETGVVSDDCGDMAAGTDRGDCDDGTTVNKLGSIEESEVSDRDGKTSQEMKREFNSRESEGHHIVSATVPHHRMKNESEGDTSSYNAEVPTNRSYGDRNDSRHKEGSRRQSWSDDEHVCYTMLGTLLRGLRDQVGVAEMSLVEAAATRPMYATLHCVRYLVRCVDLGDLKHRDEWRQLLDQVIQLCFRLSRVVSPVVQNSSPEGNIPEGLVSGLSDLDINESTTPTAANRTLSTSAETYTPHHAESRATQHSPGKASQNEDTVMLMPEYLVVCCWRGVKEVSLFLGEVVERVCLEGTDALLSHAQMSSMGDYFTNQLLESVHRGAFELAYIGFIKLCNVLWSSASGVLRKLPREWLDRALRDVLEGGDQSKMCATRRSAGLPFYIQGILNTEPAITGRPCLKAAMTVLFNISLSDDDTAPSSKIHSLNILRALYRDTKLGDEITVYVSDGFKVALAGFTAQSWAIRNCATLLFSALMTRTFGVKRSKQESILSRKNCLSSYAFFQRFPDLHEFLLSQIQITTQHFWGDHSTTHLHPSLYPTLMLLSRIFPSTITGCHNDQYSLRPFVPHVIRCADSSILKTRQMAATALQSLVSESHMTDVIRTLIGQLPTDHQAVRSHNHLHGILLQLDSLLSSMNASPQLPSVSDISQTLWAVTRQNPCNLSRQAAVQMMTTFLKTFEKLTGPPAVKSDFEELKTSLLIGLLEESHSRSDNDSVKVCDSDVKIASRALLVLVVCSLRTESFPFSAQLNSGIEVRATMRDDLLEEIFVANVRDETYEVRILFTRLVHQSVSGDYNGGVAYESTCPAAQVSVAEVLTSQQRKVLTAVCRDSRLLFEEMLSLLFDNGGGHFEVTVNVLYILSELSTSVPFPWTNKHTAYSIEEVWQHALSLVHKGSRDDVHCSVIHFTSSLLPRLLTSSHFCPASITPWVTLISDSVTPEQSTELHMAVARVLTRHADVLLLDHHCQLGTTIFDLWKVVVTLHEAQDLSVRETISHVLVQLSHEDITTQSTRSLDILIGCFINVTFPRDPIRCCETLLTWMTGGDESFEDIEEERLFDRGEMNTFSEAVMMCDLVSRHLLRLLGDVCDETVARGCDESVAHDGSVEHDEFVAHDGDISVARDGSVAHDGSAAHVESVAHAGSVIHDGYRSVAHDGSVAHDVDRSVARDIYVAHDGDRSVARDESVAHAGDRSVARNGSAAHVESVAHAGSVIHDGYRSVAHDGSVAHDVDRSVARDIYVAHDGDRSVARDESVAHAGDRSVARNGDGSMARYGSVVCDGDGSRNASHAAGYNRLNDIGRQMNNKDTAYIQDCQSNSHVYNIKVCGTSSAETQHSRRPINTSDHREGATGRRRTEMEVFLKNHSTSMIATLVESFDRVQDYTMSEKLRDYNEFVCSFTSHYCCMVMLEILAKYGFVHCWEAMHRVKERFRQIYGS